LRAGNARGTRIRLLSVADIAAGYKGFARSDAAGETSRHLGPASGLLATDDVQSVVIPGAGHWVAEQTPEEMLAALTAFLAPYRDRG
jgi:hypothetical protein